MDKALGNDDFPHDRVVFFSDAVFAIAITLLVIEIRIPDHAAVAKMGVGGALSTLMPLFIAYVVSFLVTSLFWASHLQTWKHVTTVTGGLVWLNVFQLLFVALMPFSTGYYSEYFGSNASFTFYCLNLAAIASFAYFMRAYVIRREGLEEKLGTAQVAWMKQRSLTAVFVFLACIPLAYWQPWLGRSGFLLIFAIHGLLKRHHRLKAEAA